MLFRYGQVRQRQRWPTFPSSFSSETTLRIGWIPIHVDHPGTRMTRGAQSNLEAALGGSRVAVSRQQKINGGPAGIHDVVQVGPLTIWVWLRYYDRQAAVE